MSLCFLATKQLEYWVMYYIRMVDYIWRPSIREHHSSLHMYVHHSMKENGPYVERDTQQRYKSQRFAEVSFLVQTLNIGGQ